MEKKEGGVGGGFLVVILVWGGLLYILSGSQSISGSLGLGNNNFLASTFSSFNNSLKSQKGIIGILNDKGDFQNAVVHFDKKINISDIKVSSHNPKLIFAGSSSGLFVSRDSGLNWYTFSDVEHKINSDTQVYKILFTPSGRAFVSVFQNNKGFVYKSQDNFFSLEKIIELNDEAVYDFDIIGSYLYLGLSDGRLLLYSLENDEFRSLVNLDSAITNLKISRDGRGLIYLTLKSGGLWVSADNGQSFNRLKFLDNYGGANKIENFLIAPQDNYLIYAATNYGFIRSLDSGNTWQIFKSLPTQEPKISALALRSNPGELYVASGGKIYKSRDNGLGWQIFNPELADREISIISLNDDKIIIGTRN